MIVLETPRLVLRELEPADADTLAAMYADAEVMRFIGTGGVRSRDDAADYVRSQIEAYSSRGWGEWATVSKGDDRMVGLCGLIDWPDIDGVEEVEVAYMLERAAWGKGLASEAASAIRDWGFSQLGRDRLVSLIYHDNPASIAVALKAGASWEKDVSFSGKTLALYAYPRG